MKNLYEGLFILPKTLSDEAQEAAMNRVREEIVKIGGAVNSITRLGKRTFARALGNQDAGFYVVMVFDLEGEKLAPLQARLKLNENILRVQFVRAREPGEAASAGAKQEEAGR